jgi:hypothetical protein
VRISPGSCAVAVGKSRKLHAIARDRNGNTIEENLLINWRILEGAGDLDEAGSEFATYQAPEEPGLVRIRVTATQNETVCEAEALITVTDSLLPETKEHSNTGRGLPREQLLERLIELSLHTEEYLR